MIGLGTQDSLGEAEDFIDRYGTKSFTMLWDESFESWQVIGVRSQPTAVMVGPDGEPLGGWIGAIPEAEVLEIAESYSAA